MYVKLFASILDSSVWDEAPATKLVWITMLLLADEDGFVKGVDSAIGRRAAVSAEECRAALAVLEGPDLNSQSQEYGGRRIERVEGGWQVLNYAKYREYRTREQVKAADRQRRKYRRDNGVAKPAVAAERDGREVSRSSASASASLVVRSSAHAREAGVPEDVMAGWVYYEAKHPAPEAFDTICARVAAKHGYDATATALFDMWGGGKDFSERRLMGFARIAAAPRSGGANHRPGHTNTPPPAPCLPLCGLREVEGQKRPAMVHAEGCPNAH